MDPEHKVYYNDGDYIAINSHKGYYRNEFNKIYESKGQYKGKWNWASFLFGSFWAMTKGLWPQAILSLFLTMITGGLAGPIFWFVFGFRGNHMFYNKAIKGKTKFL